MPMRSGDDTGDADALPTVLQTITRLNIGGPGRHVLDLAHGLGDRYRCQIAAGTPPGSEGELVTGAVAVQRLPLVRPVDPRRDTASLVRMRQILARNRPCLVHSHMAKAGTVTRLAAASMPRRPRVVHTFHGHVLAGYFSPRVQSTFVRVERQLARHADGLIAVSSDIRDQLLDLGIGRPGQYEVVPVGVDLHRFRDAGSSAGHLRAHLGLDASTALVGVAARLTPIKDHHVLFEALVDLPGVHLAVLGDGEQRVDLEARVQTLGLGPRVHFTGWWHDMATAFADLDVVALTSRNEGTPLSLIEASASGTPVVATDVGGVSDVVDHGRTGLLVPPGDARAVAEALGQLLAEPLRRRELGRAGQEHVARRFGLDASVQRIADLYDDLLAGTSP